MKRMKPDDRAASILDAALTLAKVDGYRNVTRVAVAAAAECGLGTVNRYYATVPQLHRAIMRAAVDRKVLGVVAQGLADGNPHAKKAPDELKRAALASLSC